MTSPTEKRRAVINTLKHRTVIVEIGGGQGSGILISLKRLGIKAETLDIPRADGFMTLSEKDILIVTCAHCVPYGARSMSIETFERRRVYADVLVLDGRADVALLKVRDISWDPEQDYANEYNLYPVDVGNSDKVHQGDAILAMGGPVSREYRFSLTEGIISKTKSYNYLSILPTFLISAKINPGNSGGLLADAETGEWIGMNSSGLFAAGGGNRGLNHAIRANEVRFWINRMLRSGKVVRDGITSMLLVDVNDGIRRKFDLKSRHGAFICAMDETEDVSKALHLWDVILEVRIHKPDNRGFDVIRIDQPQDFVYAMQKGAGLDATVKLVRKKQEVEETFSIPVEYMPFTYQANYNDFGIEMQTYRDNQGVQVTNIHPHSAAASMVERYSVIDGIEDPVSGESFIDVKNVEDFYTYAAQHGNNDFFIRVKRGALKLTIQLRRINPNLLGAQFSAVDDDDLDDDGYDDED